MPDSPCLCSSTDKHLTQSEIYAKGHFTDSFAFCDATQGLIKCELCESAIRGTHTPGHISAQLRNGSLCETLVVFLVFLRRMWRALERITGNCAKQGANPSFLAARRETETSCGVLGAGSVCEGEIMVAGISGGGISIGR